MARYTGPKCRLCRRENTKLFLKGQRCETARCSFQRRQYPPGVHGWRWTKFSDYGAQLREKQRLKRYYGVLERQFRLYFQRAERQKGNTGENLLVLMERRLDGVVHRLRFASSIAQARQLVGHGHIRVNGKKVDIPSYQIKQNDVITAKDVEGSRDLVRAALDLNKGRPLPSWLEVDEDALEGRVVSLPNREEVPVPIREQLIVELCSK